MTEQAQKTRHRILIVDDEPQVHIALARQLKGEPYDVDTASEPETALEKVKQTTYAVVIADYMMPGINGIELLKQVQAISPDTVRILFTAYSEATIAIDAINQGGISRYVLKPWNGVEIKGLVKEAVERFHLTVINKKLFEFTKLQNKALVEKTKEIELKNKLLKKLYEESNLAYLKSIQIFTGLLEVFDPWLMQHSKRCADLARLTAQKLNLPDKDRSHVEFAALLHDIGLIGLPKSLSRKKWSQCSPEEKEVLKQHVFSGPALVNKDVKFEEVAKIIHSHHERYDGKGFPDALSGESIPMGARIVAVVDAYDSLLYPPNLFDRSSEESVKGFLYNNRGSRFAPGVVDAFLLALDEQQHAAARSQTPPDLNAMSDDDFAMY